LSRPAPGRGGERDVKPTTEVKTLISRALLITTVKLVVATAYIVPAGGDDRNSPVPTAKYYEQLTEKIIADLAALRDDYDFMQELDLEKHLTRSVDELGFHLSYEFGRLAKTPEPSAVPRERGGKKVPLYAENGVGLDVEVYLDSDTTDDSWYEIGELNMDVVTAGPMADELVWAIDQIYLKHAAEFDWRFRCHFERVVARIVSEGATYSSNDSFKLRVRVFNDSECMIYMVPFISKEFFIASEKVYWFAHHIFTEDRQTEEFGSAMWGQGSWRGIYFLKIKPGDEYAFGSVVGPLEPGEWQFRCKMSFFPEVDLLEGVDNIPQKIAEMDIVIDCEEARIVIIP
jgi:hypothetical protein